jgi:hypothetical protein
LAGFAVTTYGRFSSDHRGFDEELGRLKPNSNLFDDLKDEFGDTDPISAFIAEKCEQPEVLLEGHEIGFGVVMLTQDLLSECNLAVVEKEAPGPPGHVLLIGRKTKGIRKKLARRAEWVIDCPDDAEGTRPQPNQ